MPEIKIFLPDSFLRLFPIMKVDLYFMIYLGEKKIPTNRFAWFVTKVLVHVNL
jgi:hypothetical protein